MEKIKTLAATLVILTLGATVGSALARGKPPPTPPPPPPSTPSSPPARIWHMFTGNGAGDATAGRLYLYGGDGADGVALGDLWYYRAFEHTWTVIVPSGTSKPIGRKLAGWSCGGGQCVMEGGINTKLLDETWVFTEATNAWSKVRCTTRMPCPPARYGATLAFDETVGEHLLFGGGISSASPADSVLDDTHVFDPGTRTWMATSPAHRPPPRVLAAATHVAGIGVVLFGGRSGTDEALCDMFVWTGADWEPVETNGDGPCLSEHSMAWDGTKLIVTGGWTEIDVRPNTTNWSFNFDAGGRSGTWSLAGNLVCEPIRGDDAAIRPHARMARDTVSRRQVFFGGLDDAGFHDNTVECY